MTLALPHPYLPDWDDHDRSTYSQATRQIEAGLPGLSSEEKAAKFLVWSRYNLELEDEGWANSHKNPGDTRTVLQRLTAECFRASIAVLSGDEPNLPHLRELFVAAEAYEGLSIDVDEDFASAKARAKEILFGPGLSKPDRLALLGIQLQYLRQRESGGHASVPSIAEASTTTPKWPTGRKLQATLKCLVQANKGAYVSQIDLEAAFKAEGLTEKAARNTIDDLRRRHSIGIETAPAGDGPAGWRLEAAAWQKYRSHPMP